MKKLFHVAAPALSVPARRLFPAAVPAHFPARLPAAALFPARHPFRALASALSVLLAATLVALLTSCVADDPRDADTPAAGESAQAPSTNQTSSQQNPDGQTPTGEYVDDPLSGHSYNLDDYTAVTGKSITHFSESPLLTARVAAGELPPVEERLLDNPIVVIPWETIGTYGGTLRYTATSPSGDTYLRYFNKAPLVETRPEPGTSNIVKYINATLDPGVLEYWDQDDEARRFTFRIRRGLKWSDGAPVTTEDVRFCIEDIVFDRELYPVPQEWSEWGGARVKLEIVDRYTFRLEFASSYGIFVQRMAQWRWWWFMLPSHYLKPSHVKYADIETLLPRMRAAGYSSREDWGRWYTEIHARRWGVEEFVPGKVPHVMEYPTLDPWLHVGQPSHGDLLLERNPYYYKIDPAGNQLPYIDHMKRTYVADIQMKNMKIISGETDLQFQWMRLSDFPLLKANEEAGDYHAVILRTDQENRVIYPFNFSTRDPVWNDIIRDVRFRQALSLAFNRQEMNDVLWLGAGRPAQHAPPRGSPWYEESFETAYAEYDLERAHQLLDEIGFPGTTSTSSACAPTASASPLSSTTRRSSPSGATVPRWPANTGAPSASTSSSSHPASSTSWSRPTATRRSSGVATAPCPPIAVSSAAFPTRRRGISGTTPEVRKEKSHCPGRGRSTKTAQPCSRRRPRSSATLLASASSSSSLNIFTS